MPALGSGGGGSAWRDWEKVRYFGVCVLLRRQGIVREGGSICRVGRSGFGATVGREESRRRRRSSGFNGRGLADGTGGVGRMPADGGSTEEAKERMAPISMGPDSD
jgi:hypothetical protein